NQSSQANSTEQKLIRKSLDQYADPPYVSTSLTCPENGLHCASTHTHVPATAPHWAKAAQWPSAKKAMTSCIFRHCTPIGPNSRNGPVWRILGKNCMFLRFGPHYGPGGLNSVRPSSAALRSQGWAP